MPAVRHVRGDTQPRSPGVSHSTRHSTKRGRLDSSIRASTSISKARPPRSHSQKPSERLPASELATVARRLITELQQSSKIKSEDLLELDAQKPSRCQRWACPLCWEGFSRPAPSELRRHLLCHISREELEHSCSQCSFRTGQLSNLTQHLIRMHGEGGSSICNVILVNESGDHRTHVCVSEFRDAVNRSRHRANCHLPEGVEISGRLHWQTFKGDTSVPGVVEVSVAEHEIVPGLYTCRGGDTSLFESASVRTRSSSQGSTTGPSARQPLRRSARLSRVAPRQPSPALSISDEEEEEEVISQLTFRMSPTPSDDEYMPTTPEDTDIELPVESEDLSFDFADMPAVGKIAAREDAHPLPRDDSPLVPQEPSHYDGDASMFDGSYALESEDVGKGQTLLGEDLKRRIFSFPPVKPPNGDSISSYEKFYSRRRLEASRRRP